MNQKSEQESKQEGERESGKKIFLTDLDNTLIYSHRRELGAPKQNVEWYEGRQISFMTVHSQQLLRELQDKLTILPCTTRSVAQYRRIALLPDWQPRWALVANGGILLEHGQIVPRWYAESKAQCAQAEEQMLWAQKLLEQQTDLLLPVKWVDQLFLFTKSARPEQLQRQLQQQLDCAQVQVRLQGQKVYVLPQGLSKGNALQRLRKACPDSVIYAAGDSEFDVSMLLAADFAFAPEALADALTMQQQKQLIPAAQLLSEAVLSALLKL